MDSTLCRISQSRLPSRPHNKPGASDNTLARFTPMGFRSLPLSGSIYCRHGNEDVVGQVDFGLGLEVEGWRLEWKDAATSEAL